MLSKVVSSFVLRNPASKKMVTPFLLAKTNALYCAPQRHFIDRLGLNHSSDIATTE